MATSKTPSYGTTVSTGRQRQQQRLNAQQQRMRDETSEPQTTTCIERRSSSIFKKQKKIDRYVVPRRPDIRTAEIDGRKN
ncbi:hypothetical protein OUZ56_007506 [Daphnia magna]|uniref:Uncharacterized protein n=1 Tax=Daphnia magna TaxID=35525 RepID=A0ABR0AAC0_9CRUS|nr:hypothetical protein OUZ56_007506 [Daphnia magna]